MKKQLVFGMPTLIENDTLEQNLKLCQTLSLSFLELNMNFPQYQLPELQKTAALREAAVQAGVFYTIHLDENLDIANFNPLISEAYLETVKRTIRVAKELRAPLLNLHMNHGIFITLPDKKVELYGLYREQYMESFQTFRKLCESEIGDSELKICIENTDGFRDYEIEVIENLLESPYFRLTFDIGHSHAVKNIDEDFLLKHRDKLFHFHIHDAIGKSNHLTLGTGEIDLKQRLELAKEQNCRCVLETKTVAALTESVQWLKKNF